MRPAFLLFFLSAIFYSSELLAQTDSTFTDTVVIIKDPHVIRHEVVIRSPSEPERKMLPMKFGLYYGIGGNNLKSNEPSWEINGKLLFNYGFQISYALNKVEFTAGLGCIATKLKYHVTKSYEVIRYQTEIITVVIEEWEETREDGKVVRHQITEDVESIIEVRNKIYYKDKISSRMKYLQIPFCISYSFRMSDKLALSPGVQVILNKNLGSANENLFERKKTIWSAGCLVKAEYSLSEHLSAEIKGFAQQCLGNLNRGAISETWKMYGLNIGLNYKL